LTAPNVPSTARVSARASRPASPFSKQGQTEARPSDSFRASPPGQFARVGDRIPGGPTPEFGRRKMSRWPRRRMGSDVERGHRGVNRWSRGDAEATGEILPPVYPALRRGDDSRDRRRAPRRRMGRDRTLAKAGLRRKRRHRR
jgi:hypothetical protein